MKHRLKLVALILLPLTTSILLASCQSPTPRQDVVGLMMPEVTGESLQGKNVSLPQYDSGRPAVILIGYKQRAQFDADRWLFGLLQAETPVALWELPTIPGIFGGMASGWIDNGMRGGIPQEDWGAVVTLYGDDADRMKDFTGTEDGHNIRVMLLDANGQVQWMHDRGYSAGKMLELDRRARSLIQSGQ
ncbi:MAG: hypothetical protein GY747_02190 [Planctomycetes bacterium]|nr:hypothetical protein [Planctomycetota bacterium]MCP4770674.1 hypothetical protein [Planctomycetota bacterium]MCP4860557.1 hypothetical protein [Planctomycetota bacterium]